MANSDPLSFEEKLRTAVKMPQPRQEFLAGLRDRLEVEITRPLSFSERLGLIIRRPTIRQRVGALAGLVAMLIVASFLIAGPQHVFAAVSGLLGYIPGVGIVDSSAPVRVLAEPIIVVKGEIAITFTSAVATGDRTHIDYRIFGVPASAYPTREDVQGCLKTDYLRLPDGTRLEHLGNDFQPVPEHMRPFWSFRVFSIPCRILFQTTGNFQCALCRLHPT